MISEIAVGIVTGLISSAVVSVAFYLIGRNDANSEARIAQLDVVLFRINNLAPNRLDSSPSNIRTLDGVDATSHWLICTADVMRATGFCCGESLLRSIADEMRQECPPEDLGQKSLEQVEAGEVRKTAWRNRLLLLRGELSQSPLARMRDILDDRG